MIVAAQRHMKAADELTVSADTTQACRDYEGEPILRVGC